MAEVSQSARNAAAKLHTTAGRDEVASLTAAGALDMLPTAQAFASFEAEIRAETPPADADAVKRLIAAVDAWIEDPNPDAEQGIMDARAALRGLGGEKG